MKADGYEPLLKHSRWALLKNPWKLTEGQSEKLGDLLRYNLKTVRAYLLEEELQLLWTYQRAGGAARFLDRWCTRTLCSRIEPMKKIARTLRGQRVVYQVTDEVTDDFMVGICQQEFDQGTTCVIDGFVENPNVSPTRSRYRLTMM